MSADVPRSDSFSLTLLGGCALSGPAGPLGGRVAQRRRLAVLAVVAASGRDGVSRDRLLALLWPESTVESARHRLADTLSVLRAALGETALRSVGDRVALNADAVDCDVRRFADAVRQGDAAAAATAYGGPFLDGFHIPDAPDFERWADAERDRVHAAYLRALETLAGDADRRSDVPAAVELWRRAAAAQPYDSRIAGRLMDALDRAGDRAGAISHLRAHTTLLRSDLDVEPSPELRAAAERMRAGAPAATPSQPHTSVEEPPARSAGVLLAGETPPTEPPREAHAPTPPPTPAPGAAVASQVASPSAPQPTPMPVRRTAGPLGGRHFLAAALGLALTALGGWSFLQRGDSDLADRRVVVAPLVNETGDRSLDVLGRMAADWVTQGMSATGLGEVVPSSAAVASSRYVDSLAARTGGDHTRLLALETGAALVVTGAIYRVGDSIRVHAQVTDARRARVVRALEPISAPASAPTVAIERLRQRTLGALAPLLDERVAARLDERIAPAASRSAPPSYEAYREVAEAVRIGIGNGGGRRMLEHLERAHALDAAYVTPLLMMTNTNVNMGRWATADSLARRLEGARERLTPFESASLDLCRAWIANDAVAAYRAAKRAVVWEPGGLMAVQVAREALRLNRPAEAVEVLRSLHPERGELREYAGYWTLLAETYHLLGRFDEELTTVRRARAIFPDEPDLPYAEARALAALGRPAESLALVEARFQMPSARGLGLMNTMSRLSSEFARHGHPNASRLAAERLLTWLDSQAPAAEQARDCRLCRAQLLLTLGRAAEAEPILSTLVAEDTTKHTPLLYLGVAAASAGHRAVAERARARLATLTGRDSATFLYGRAAITAHLGDRQGALTLLQEALAHGFPFVGTRFHLDVALDPLRGDPAFETLVRPRELDLSPSRARSVRDAQR
jgi:DNA-binding SARP family transcriptional activator/TolB-like protein